MELKDCRRRIDEINSEMERLFLERMEISLDVAAYKQEHHLPTFDPAREREILRRAREKAPAGLAPYVSHLFQQLMEMGRSADRTDPRGAGKHPQALPDRCGGRLPGGGRGLFPDCGQPPVPISRDRLLSAV